jgi:hypothetical protein
MGYLVVRVLESSLQVKVKLDPTVVQAAAVMRPAVLAHRRQESQAKATQAVPVTSRYRVAAAAVLAQWVAILLQLQAAQAAPVRLRALVDRR